MPRPRRPSSWWTGIHHVNAVTLAFSASPGTPKDRVQLLRRALAATLKDPAMLAEAKSAQQEVDPLSGKDLAKTMANFAKLAGPVKKKLAEVLLPRSRKIKPPFKPLKTFSDRQNWRGR